MTFEKVAIVGATGPTGFHLAALLRGRNIPVRVVSRSHAHLDRLFSAEVEKVAADALQADEITRAIEGCDLVYDCIGLPGDQMHLHPATAGALAAALGATGARCIQVSSYWAYLPLVRSPLDETHPRADGGPWMRYRREAEDILRDAGAAILHLPDFFGTQVHTSTLQQPLREAVAGKPMTWIGRAEVERGYILVSDAMRIAAEIAVHDAAYGADWILPSPGGLSGARAAEIAGAHLGREVKLRTVGMTALRIAGLFDRNLRDFKQIAPDYLKPIAYDATKLAGLIGAPELTPYERAIPQTLDWIAARRQNKR